MTVYSDLACLNLFSYLCNTNNSEPSRATPMDKTKTMTAVSPMLGVITFIICAAATAYARPVAPNGIRFHNEDKDTTRITEILTKVSAADPGTSGERVAMIGNMFIGTPYVAHTLEAAPGEDEQLTVNMDELDCTTFVETVTALAMTVGEGRTSWRDFVHNLERIRYRGGELNGYPSRLHYIADWVTNNSYRGNIIDAAPLFPAVSYTTKSINFMTNHRDLYPALTDSANFERVQSTEMGYRNHRFPYIKTRNLSEKPTKAAFRNGDLVALTSSLKDLDVTHMGIILLRDGVPYLLHASSSLGKVTVTDVPLDVFMKRNKSLTGLRVMRLKE